MRYFITLAYKGTRFAGWQRQPKAPSVQAVLEEAIAGLLQHPVAVTGCGRTDAGVHASHYVAHFDTEKELSPRFLIGVNSLLPPDVAVYRVQEVPGTLHARFDAVSRAYTYVLTGRKDPFLHETAWFCPQFNRLEVDTLQAVARVFPQYDEFLPFCKTHSGVDHYRCKIHHARWEKVNDHTLEFHIGANRFLRGMVRLMVGAAVKASLGQLKVSSIDQALATQEPLSKNFSVPPQGLFLSRVEYEPNYY